MLRENAFDQLLLELYRGVTSDSAWGNALDRTSDALRGSAIFFGSLGPNGSTTIGHRIAPACADAVGGPLATPEANPFVAAMCRTPIGRAVPTKVVCGDAALVRSRVYQDALRPHGQRYVLGATLERLGPTMRSLALSRAAADGDYTDEDVGLFDRLLPHLARALHLRSEFADVRQRSVAAFAALDTVPRGIVILSGDLCVLFANREAQRIFALDDGLGATVSGLHVNDRQASAQLRKSLERIVFEDPGSAGSLPAPIAVRRPSGRPAFCLSLVPAPELLEGSAAGPPIAVTIIDPDRQSSPAESLLRQLYGLTAMEAKLAAALCEADLKGAALELQISLNTAKTHLQSVFQKVGVSRQSALVRRITLALAN